MLKLLITMQTLPSLLLQRTQRGDKGATMIEYGIICALIIGVVVIAMGLLNGSIATLFTKVSTNINDAKI